jgi:acyl-CoA hydrolase
MNDRAVESERPTKTVRASHAEMLQLVLPSDANTLGNALGGVVMHHMDIVAAIAAQRHASFACVTASVDRIDFLHPATVGDVLVLKASVNYAGRTSMEVGVWCAAENPRTGRRRHTASAYFTFVALDVVGTPAEVPRLVPESADEQRRYEKAQRRRADRLSQRDGRSKNDDNGDAS